MLHSCCQKSYWKLSKFILTMNSSEFSFGWFECCIENDSDWLLVFGFWFLVFFFSFSFFFLGFFLVGNE